MKPLKRVVIKEELVELTGDFRSALILNQFIYWSERMHDTDNFIRQEKERAIKHQMEVSIEESNGWIYKSAEELNEELMVGMSKSTIGKYIKQLVEAGYLYQRGNPNYKWDKTLQYRIDLYKIQKDLSKLGYALEGYKLLPNIEIYEGLEEEIYENNLDENKEAFSNAIEKANEKNKNIISNDDNIVPQSNDNCNREFLENETIENKTIDHKESYKEKILENESIKDCGTGSLECKNEKDYIKIAYDRCLNEIEGFESLEQIRKDFHISVMLRKIALE